MNLRRSPVEAHHTLAPQPVEDVRVVAVSEERLRIVPSDGRVQVGDHGDLVLATDHRENCPDRRVGERGVEVSGTLERCRRSACARVLDRYESGHLREPSHRLLVNFREDLGCSERRRHDGDCVPGTGLARMHPVAVRESHLDRIFAVDCRSLSDPAASTRPQLAEIPRKAAGRSAP
jgi:hypothetical protein